MIIRHSPVDRKALIVIFPHGELWIGLNICCQSLYMIVMPASDAQEQLGLIHLRGTPPSELRSVSMDDFMNSES